MGKAKKTSQVSPPTNEPATPGPAKSKSAMIAQWAIDFWTAAITLLPQLKTAIQLTGLIVVVAGFIAYKHVEPEQVPGVIAAGAVGVLFLVFGQLFRAVKNPWVLSLFFVVFCIFSLLLFLIAISYFTPHSFRSVRIFLEQKNQLVKKDFDITCFVPDINPIRERGHLGTVSIQLPLSAHSIPKIDLNCKDYKLKHEGPYPVEQGEVHLKLVLDEVLAPLDPIQFPDVQSIDDMPAKEQVQRPPKHSPSNVTLWYKNDTDTNLRLLLFSCSIHYGILNAEGDALKPISPWYDFDFPASSRFDSFGGFQKGTGWYCFFVYREPEPNTPNIYYLGCRSIFGSKNPKVTIGESGVKDKPFELTLLEE